MSVDDAGCDRIPRDWKEKLLGIAVILELPDERKKSRSRVRVDTFWWQSRRLWSSYDGRPRYPVHAVRKSISTSASLGVMDKV